MTYFPTKADCPNKAMLAGVTLEQASEWSAAAPSHCTEVSRRAEVQTFYGLTRQEEQAAFDAAIQRRALSRAA